jgi:hypothetical protein
VKDYYSILGLDADASPESIKVAYRRLAREAHPDRAGHKSADAQAAASSQMAELNEAYSTLSDSFRRKTYDDEFRKWQAKAATTVAEPEPEAPPPVPEPDVPQPQRPAARPQPQVGTNVVSQFSTQVHSRLMQNSPAFKWSGVRMEGFDWAMQSGFLLAEYFVALRGFALADPAAAGKLINYASVAIERTRRIIKKNYYLLLVPFQRMREPEQVLAACRRFAGGSGEGALAGVQTQIVLMDVTHGRSVPCGPMIEDKRFEGLMQRLGFSR